MEDIKEEVSSSFNKVQDDPISLTGDCTYIINSI